MRIFDRGGNKIWACTWSPLPHPPVKKPSVTAVLRNNFNSRRVEMPKEGDQEASDKRDCGPNASWSPSQPALGEQVLHLVRPDITDGPREQQQERIRARLPALVGAARDASRTGVDGDFVDCRTGWL